MIKPSLKYSFQTFQLESVQLHHEHLIHSTVSAHTRTTLYGLSIRRTPNIELAHPDNTHLLNGHYQHKTNRFEDIHAPLPRQHLSTSSIIPTH